MDDDYYRDQELRDRQGGRTFRMGSVLRGTFDSSDAELEPAVTRLMLQLTHVPYGEEKPPVASQAPSAAVAPSLLRRIAGRLRFA